MSVIGFWELREEDQPPVEYYGDDEALKEWFAAVKEKYAHNDEDEPLEKVPQVQNEATKELLGR